jgi:hypothetical protein
VVRVHKVHRKTVKPKAKVIVKPKPKNEVAASVTCPNGSPSPSAGGFDWWLLLGGIAIGGGGMWLIGRRKCKCEEAPALEQETVGAP